MDDTIDVLVDGDINATRRRRRLPEWRGVTPRAGRSSIRYTPSRSPKTGRCCSKELAPKYEAILAASTTHGKNVLPRLAALLDVAQLSDIVEVQGPDTFKRYIYAGNALATVRTSDPLKVITVRTTAFDAAPVEGGSASIERIDAVDPAGWPGSSAAR